jgi:hypothetical protein
LTDAVLLSVLYMRRLCVSCMRRVPALTTAGSRSEQVKEIRSPLKREWVVFDEKFVSKRVVAPPAAAAAEGGADAGASASK